MCPLTIDAIFIFYDIFSDKAYLPGNRMRSCDLHNKQFCEFIIVKEYHICEIFSG